MTSNLDLHKHFVRSMLKKSTFPPNIVKTSAARVERLLDNLTTSISNILAVNQIKSSGRKRKKNEDGPDRGSNPEPLAPKARIIPLDHQATVSFAVSVGLFRVQVNFDRFSSLSSHCGAQRLSRRVRVRSPVENAPVTVDFSTSALYEWRERQTLSLVLNSEEERVALILFEAS